MKINVDRIEDEGRWQHIYFAHNLYCTAYQEATNDIGTRAVRILRMHIGAAAKIKFFRDTVDQITIDYPKRIKAIHTVEAMQAVMDRHANKRLTVRLQDIVVTASGISGGSKRLQTVDEIRDCYRQHHDVTIGVERKIQLNMPIAPRDQPRVERLLPGLFCDGEGDMYGECGPNELRVWAWLLLNGQAKVRGYEDPWTLMKSLESKIKKLIT